MTKTIDIKGTVVDDETAAFYSFFGIPSASPSAVSQILNDGVDDDDVEVNVASNGGDVFSASEIYTMLRQSKANVTVNIQGLAASAASVIAMAGNKVNISPTAQLMIHQAASYGGGNKDDLAHEIDVLDGIDKSIASAYESKTGMPQGDLLNMMAQETWIGAQEAVDKGFADEIMFVDEKQAAFSNATANIVPKSAVNKLLNLLNKSEKTAKLEKEVKNSQPTSDLKQSKLAILLGKTKEK
ncbi:head maturation protease, ClpP-related [Leuconostoc mesenteroides]|uniref:head maturation protease, ClpP-related n=1 Tax=Leuconostoc mesenteroides TaxID=1245 RepID=UPI000B8D2CAB|nr:head maturation protease, ClpP-related [Leuconostoc mesenteroides]ASR69267.1 peptidase [Leuconostoc mesenteroides]KAA8348758.1 Clp protease ClpP [Leuconostoc mesenteroides]MCT8391504.1 Clp protease ClpP [Leuconostoc mesenteroides]